MRRAARGWLTTHASSGPVTVAVSGGADSLALASALLFTARHTGHEVHGVTVDHQLQRGSAERAAAVVEWLTATGCASAEVRIVEVGDAGGPEAAARDARYAALRAAARGPVLLAHTLDDQAETVLLGLGRGAGPRSLRAMAEWDPPYGRPLLGVRRATTRRCCADLGIEFWDDPHNVDPRYTRVRLRTEALPLLEEILGGGVAPALARTASLLRESDQTEIATSVLGLVADGDALDAGRVAGLPGDLRRRVLKAWLDGLPIAPTTAAHVDALDVLVTAWRGQGPAYLPGGAKAQRVRGRIHLVRPDQHGRSAPIHRPAED
ncbi:tRNA lysidine(34) synthetase TilS [Epidermidibacterium keratini]